METWAEDVKTSTFVGMCTLKLQECMNTKNTYDVLDAGQKKVGHVLLRLY